MFQRILVPLDRSELAEQAIGQAAAIARGSRGMLDVVLVHEALLLEGFTDSSKVAERVGAEEKYLKAIANELSAGTGLPVTYAVVQGSRIDMICRRVWQVNADLIVMTSHGRTGLSRAWMGSTADGVLRHSATPVLILRPIEGKAARLAAEHLFKHILVPLDGSALAADALTSAVSLAESSGASISLFRVVEPMPFVMIDIGIPFVYPYPVAAPDDATTKHLVDEAKADLADVARQLRNEGIPNVETEVVVTANVAQAIIDHARSHNIDVIAMSTHGRGASRVFLGSVTDKVIRAGGLPVLVHRPIAVREGRGVGETARIAETPALAGA